MYNQLMFLFGIVFFFLLGAIVGSFLNVLVFRSGVSSLFGRSRCLLCGTELRWFELIPLLSFFLQGRRCRSCRSRISWQYPLVELVTGLVFAAIFWKHFSFLSLFSYSVIQLSVMSAVIQLLVISYELLVWSLLIAIAVYDLRHKVIPDSFVYGFIFLSFLHLLISYFIFHISSPRDFLGGPLLALALASVWFLSRGRAIGLGDAKLALGMGWFLGFVGGLSAFILGFWLGALYALAALAARFIMLRTSFCPTLKLRLQGLTMKTELPLAPFLIAGTLIVYLTGVDVTGVSLLLQ